MGTDIHFKFQAKIDGGWKDVSPENYDGHRHYALFAWLGNVRNGFGFAGIPTHSVITPLSDCRGFPNDFVCDENNDFMGYHSFSWLDADEILSAIPPLILRVGVISKEAFYEWDGSSIPTSWSGDIYGPNIVISFPGEVTEKTTHVKITWEEDTAIAFKYFIDEVRHLKAKYSTVRFVFGFAS